ncbi:outer membrane protein assembly factor BamD [Faecalibacter bovis]|uniref:Outer membrane protein assembly factor BamD n=1 Tax=Faecalibacter bovis TaxID=2898187 RepID=A0ABX7XC50_9FLAO|nr:outer membrane protein assembly factor BamD [Faecalibacter bovis]MBS7332776.1 outer membrane protein assembly factor BamD [Weeksellaceae bacterium]QTV05465.1 outer membrane protein assembly factor BamD [Faecalibacter bovis]
MLKKLTLIVLVGLALSSCNKEYNKAMKSTDKDEIFNIATQLYNQKKYTEAIELYDRISTSFVGTEQAADIAYNTADAHFNDQNFKLAGHLFKNFSGSYPMDKRAEEALYLSAFSYYKDSPKYNLDQTSTFTAIDELQGFINSYPNSEHVNDANKYITELRQKLELKAFEIGKVYYKTMKYKAAGVAFDNMVDEYPDSKFREEAMMYSLRSKAELAINFSRIENKDLRLQEARTQYRQLSKFYPNSQYKSEAEKLLKNIEADLEKSKKELAEIEKAKKEAIANNK